jgi:polyhydroxyalkanoate synthesis regulator phasin
MANSYKTKSVYFSENEFDLLKRATNKSELLNKNFSDYVKELIKQDLTEQNKLPDYMEKRIIELIKKYAPAANDKDIKEDMKFDPEAVAALDQFDDI